MEPWLVRAAHQHGESVALSGADGASDSYQALLRRAQSVAGALQEQGIDRADRVALVLTGSEMVVAVHACLLLGAAAVPIDLRLGEDERELRIEGSQLVLEELPLGPPATPVEVEPDQTATVMFTSGTAAAPKEVALTYDNWQANAFGSALALGLDQAERWLCPMPLAHVGGLSIPLRSVIYGTSVVLHERFDTQAVLDELQDPGRGVTLVSLVPTMLNRLLEAGLRDPPSLRWALLGGGPIAPVLLSRARAAGVNVAASYGMTEGCSQIATHGWPLFGVELRVDAPEGTDSGEVLVRGRNVAPGSLAEDGWLHTGDVGRLEDRTGLVIEGRLSDMIVTGGENVAPDEVEAALLEHPAVAEAAVFARPDPEWGEAVIAAVVRADEDATGEDLRQHCNQRLAPFKVPKQVEFVDALPRGSTGKLLRRELS
jgi:O-succinylbenzoic acid--CoA ligase